MNEFNAQTGGRYVYVDDVLNLQDLALAFGRVFDECDNFIISGCEVSGSTISAGYVYLNGKIRHFSGASGITVWPQYLYENNSTESVHYASGNTKIGRNIYGVSIGSSIPTTADALTGKVPVSMVITQSGGTLMKDAFFGKYALVLNSATLSQVLNGTLKIDGDLEVTGNVRSLQNHYRIIESQATFDASFSDGSLNLKTLYDSSNNSYIVSMENGVGVGVYVNGTLVSTTNANGILLPGNIQASLGTLGCIGLSNSGIYNQTDATNSGTVNINVVGYNGEQQYFRNTVIGNGKGTAVLSVNGQNQTVSIAGVTTIASGTSSEGIVFALDKPKTYVGSQKAIVWKDSDSVTMGQLGYTESTDVSFRVTNNVAGVYVYGANNSFVDLGPVIKENGQLLTDKYVQITNFDATIATVAKIVDVYDKAQSDARYSKVSDGFSGYISYGNTEETLRKQIDAVGSDDLNAYLKKSAYLSDIATNDTNKKKIRDNIGAAGLDEFQPKLIDSGWVQLLYPGLWIRQIGNIVSIQGTLTTVHSGTVFTIPNTIDPPTYAIRGSVSLSNKRTWVVGIAGNSRACQVEYCDDSCNREIKFSLTYMV